MKELTIDEYLEKYPNLKEQSKSTLFIPKEDFFKIKKSELINVGTKAVSIEFLKQILKNDFYFEYASRFFAGTIDSFEVSYIFSGYTGRKIGYDRVTIIKAMKKWINSKHVILQPDEKKRLEYLKDNIIFDKFLEKHKGNNYNIVIEGNKYSIPIDQLVSLLELPYKKFDRLCLDSNKKFIYEIPKEYFIYAAYKFFSDEVLTKYFIPTNIARNYHAIDLSERIDIMAINKYLVTTDTKYQEITLDNDLKNEIICQMPSDATPLEKAIYIYIKMCKLLTYDEEYYAVGQTGAAAEKHKSVDYISSINLKNNKVVCFEFNLIYSKLLSELDIHFCSSYLGGGEENYGFGHANLNFRVDKFLIRADSATSILLGDIMLAKLNQPLVGLKCLNINYKTRYEFKETLTKMYRLIADQEKNIKDVQEVEHIQTLDELLIEYSKTTESIEDISLNERLSILIDKVNSTQMVGIDSLSYILQLYHILFTFEQIENNISLTIVRNNNPIDVNSIAMPIAIFTLNEQGFQENPTQNIYYYYSPNSKLIMITRKELQNKFDDRLFEYIYVDDTRIPGIKEDGEKIR